MPRTVVVQDSVEHDRTHDRAACVACGDTNIICDMYYLSDFQWKLVRDNRHLWKLDENGIMLRCRWCKGEQANRDRLRRRQVRFFLTPNAAGDTTLPVVNADASFCMAYAQRDTTGVCSGTQHDPLSNDVHKEVFSSTTARRAPVVGARG